MELLDFLLQDVTISSYLSKQPNSKWAGTVKKTLLYGIYSLKALKYAGFKPAHAKQRLSLHPPSSEPKPHCKEHAETLTARTQNSKTLRNKSQKPDSKGPNREFKPGFKQSKRKITKVVVCADPKLKENVFNGKLTVQSSKRTHRRGSSRQIQNELRGLYGPQRALEVVSVTPNHASGSFVWSDSPNDHAKASHDSDPLTSDSFSRHRSSLSSVNPPEEMRKFYQNEFKTLMPTSSPAHFFVEKWTK